MGNKKFKNRLSVVMAFCLLSIFLGTVFWGCSVHSGRSYTKDDKDYGAVAGAFRHRWWNFYQRGLSYAEGEFYQEALADLKEAVKQRDKDQRMARTYGMHFIDYFPHRELGVVYYSMGNMREAEKELETSFNQFPTSKASYYLDHVRKALIKQEGQVVEPPKVSLTQKESELRTKDDPVIISGLARDENYVSGIQINQIPLYIEGTRKEIVFKKELALSQGDHVVEITVKNLPGKITKRQVVIHVDREGPMITLEDMEVEQSGAKKVVKLNGSVFDESGVADFSINGETVPLNPGLDCDFIKRLTVERNDLELVAHDSLGNQTTTRISLLAPSSSSSFSPSSTFSPTFSWPSSLSLSSPPRHPVMVASADISQTILVLASLLSSKDKQTPVIELRGWADSQTVFLPKVYIEGEVRDEGMVESLTINQKPVLRKKGKSVFFNTMAELKERENIIIFEARNEAGNKAVKKISIIRQVAKAFQLAERLSLAVLPFEQKGTQTEASQAFQDNLIAALVNQNRFRVVDRQKLDAILEEQKISQSKLVDQSTAIKLGRLVGAQAIITGSMIESRTGLEIVARLIDTETSDILAITDAYDEMRDLPAIRHLAEGIAIKFHRSFPLREGIVVDQKGKHIFTDLGADKIELQRRLVIYREEQIKHPVSGKILGSDSVILGRARVSQVMSDLSKGEIVSGESSTIKIQDRVITE